MFISNGKRIMKKKAIFTLMIVFGILAVIIAEAFEPLFDAHTDYSTGDNLNYMVAGDLNQDGYPDLAVTNETEMTVSIFMNKNDGTFADAVKYEIGKRPQSIVLGDLNQDGYPDFVTANRLSNTLSIYFNDGTGVFSDKAEYTTAWSCPEFVAAGDLNQDGYLDLVVTTGGGGPFSVYVLFNQGKGTFMNGGAYRSYPLASSLSIGDLNQDKYPDLIITKYGVIYTSGYSPFGDGSMSVFINKGNGIFGEAVEYSTDKWPKSIGLGDFNNDEYIDVAIGNSSSRTVSIFMNEGNGSFGEKIKHITKNYAPSIAVGKLDHDGYDDLVVTNYYDNTLSVFINKGGDSFEGSTDYAVAQGPRCVIIEDFNQDGYSDLAVIKSDDTLSVLLNTGSSALLNTDSYKDSGMKEGSGMKTDLSTVQVPSWYFQPLWWYQWGTVQGTFPSFYQDPGLNGWFTDENFIVPFYCFPYLMEIPGHMLYEDQFTREWPFGGLWENLHL